MTELLVAASGKKVASDIGAFQTFTDDFESGDLATNWPTRVGAVSAPAAAAFAGSNGARISPAGASAQIATSNVKWDQNTHPWFRLAVRMRFNALQTTGTADLITVQNNLQLNNCDLFLNNTDEAFRIDLTGAEANFDTGLVPVVDQWYFIQIRGHYGSTYRAQLKIDDVVFPWLEDPGETPSNVRSLHFGTGSAKTYEFDIDNVDMLVCANRPPLLEAI